MTDFPRRRLDLGPRGRCWRVLSLLVLLAWLVPGPAVAAPEAGCRVGRDGAQEQDITAELATAFQRCREILVAPGRFRLRHTLQVPSGVTLRGTLGSDGKQQSRIAADPAILDQEGSLEDAILVPGTFLTAGNPIPFRGNTSLYATIRLPVAAFSTGARTLQLTDPAQFEKLTAALGGGRLDPSQPWTLPTLFLFSDRYWRHGFNNFRPLFGEVNQITAIDAATRTVTLAKPTGFGVADGMLGLPDRRRNGPITTPSGAPIPQYIASYVTIADLELAATGLRRAPLTFLGCFMCRFTHLDLTGGGIIGGNALAWSTVSDITGAFTNVLMDTGYLTNHSTFERFDVRYDRAAAAAEVEDRPRQVDQLGRVRGGHLDEPERAARPLIQHGESSSQNTFRDFKVALSGRSFQDLFRLTGIRGAVIEDFDVAFRAGNGARLQRSLVNLNDHEPEDFLFVLPQDACFGSGSGGGGAAAGEPAGKTEREARREAREERRQARAEGRGREARAQRAQEPEQQAAAADPDAAGGAGADGKLRQIAIGGATQRIDSVAERPIKASGTDGRLRAQLLGWDRSRRDEGFLAAITNGSTVTDSQGCKATVALALQLDLPAGGPGDRLAAKIAAQDAVEGGRRFTVEGQSSGVRRQVLEVVELTDRQLTVLVDAQDPARAFTRGERARTDLFPGLDARVGSAFIGNDNRQPTVDVRTGAVEVARAGTGEADPDLGVIRGGEAKRQAGASASGGKRGAQAERSSSEDLDIRIGPLAGP